MGLGGTAGERGLFFLIKAGEREGVITNNKTHDSFFLCHSEGGIEAKKSLDFSFALATLITNRCRKKKHKLGTI